MLPGCYAVRASTRGRGIVAEEDDKEDGIDHPVTEELRIA